MTLLGSWSGWDGCQRAGCGGVGPLAQDELDELFDDEQAGCDGADDPPLLSTQAAGADDALEDANGGHGDDRQERDGVPAELGHRWAGGPVAERVGMCSG